MHAITFKQKGPLISAQISKARTRVSSRWKNRVSSRRKSTGCRFITYLGRLIDAPCAFGKLVTHRIVVDEGRAHAATLSPPAKPDPLGRHRNMRRRGWMMTVIKAGIDLGLTNAHCTTKA